MYAAAAVLELCMLWRNLHVAVKITARRAISTDVLTRKVVSTLQKRISAVLLLLCVLLSTDIIGHAPP